MPLSEIARPEHVQPLHGAAIVVTGIVHARAGRLPRGIPSDGRWSSPTAAAAASGLSTPSARTCWQWNRVPTTSNPTCG